MRLFIDEGMKRQLAVQKKVTPKLLLDVLDHLIDLAKGVQVQVEQTNRKGEPAAPRIYTRIPDVKAIQALFRLGGGDPALQTGVALSIARAQRELAQMGLLPAQSRFYEAQTKRAETETGAYTMTLVGPEHIELAFSHLLTSLLGFLQKIPCDEMRVYVVSDTEYQKFHVRFAQYAEKRLAEVLDELRAESTPPAVGRVQHETD
jgi:hypothetical protein